MVNGAAVGTHGWILAGAIDVLPLFFLVLAFVLSREVWLSEEVVREKLSAERQDGADRQKVASRSPMSRRCKTSATVCQCLAGVQKFREPSARRPRQ